MVSFLAAVLGVCLRSHWHVAAPIAVMPTGGKRSGNAHRWQKVKHALLAYKSLYDDLLVPRGFVIPKDADWPEELWDLKLGNTVRNIRNQGTYSTNRAELEEMGFDFDPQRAVYGWEKVKHALLAYKSLYDDLLVPSGFVIPKDADWPEELWDLKLGNTVDSIRNQGTYSTNRAELEEMGFDFDPQRAVYGWEKVKHALLAYKSLYDDLLVPQGFVIPKDADWPEELWDLKLGNTVNSIRNQGTYSTNRAELEEMGFDFDPQRAVYGWEKVKHALLAYKSLYDDLLVPSGFVIPKDADWPEELWDLKLGNTVRNIRNQGTYSTNRAELEEMGFDFDPQRAINGWEKVKHALLAYKSLYDDLLVPSGFVIPKDADWPEELWDLKLGNTVNSIRNQGIYSTNRAELEEMGFDFDPQRAVYGWEKVKHALLAYKSLYDDLLVPQGFVIPKDADWPEELWDLKLGNTVYGIRNQGTYSTNRAELEEMGFDFDPQRAVYGWEKVKHALLAYKSLYDDLLVPQGFVIPKDADWPEELWDLKFGNAVYSIRNQGIYSTNRAELEEMGFDFDPQRTVYGWAKVKHALLAYKSLYDDLLVPSGFVIPKDADWPEELWDLKLGSIVSTIRNSGHHSTNRAELEDMGFEFESQQREGHILGEKYEVQVLRDLEHETCIFASPVDDTVADLEVPLPGNSMGSVRRFEHFAQVVEGIDVGDPALWIPTKRNFTAVDCLVTRGKDVFFIQITTASRHGIALRTVNGKEGLLTMTEALQRGGFDVGKQHGIHFVWVTPGQFQGSHFARGDENDDDEALAAAIKQYNCIMRRTCDAEPTALKAMET